MIEFVQTNFVPLMLCCLLLFLMGLGMWIVGSLMNSHYTKKLRGIEANMDDETWEQWAREQGYRRSVR